MGLKIGICGTGGFGNCFIPLFKAHPLVEELAIADLSEERLNDAAERFGIARAYRTLDELCRSDVDAVGIFTQRWLHAPQAIQAMQAGKHVFSAVPPAITLEELDQLLAVVKTTGQMYMLGETSYYYPTTIYCRKRFAQGDFGRFVYAEAEYIHDMSHGFYDAYRIANGPHWKRFASFPPMLYPTHSVSMVLSVTGARMTQVSCLGFVDDEDDGVFQADVSRWGNTFSNETALFRTSDGGMCRINEFRRIGWSETSRCASVRMSLYGTKGSFEEQGNAKSWNTRFSSEPEDIADLLTCQGVEVSEAERQGAHEALVRDFHSGLSPVHPGERLPAEFRGLPNGHEGSHQFLTDDFVTACTTGNLPPNHVWMAARYCAPGIVAHQSALRDGESLAIPDFGNPPVAPP